MTTLDEIEAATERLSDIERGALLAFLIRRMSSPVGPMPKPRTYSKEQIDQWIAEDEADMREYLAFAEADKKRQTP